MSSIYNILYYSIGYVRCGYTTFQFCQTERHIKGIQILVNTLQKTSLYSVENLDIPSCIKDHTGDRFSFAWRLFASFLYAFRMARSASMILCSFNCTLTGGGIDTLGCLPISPTENHDTIKVLHMPFHNFEWQLFVRSPVTCCRKKDHPLLRFQPRFDVSDLV